MPEFPEGIGPKFTEPTSGTPNLHVKAHQSLKTFAKRKNPQTITPNPLPKSPFFDRFADYFYQSAHNHNMTSYKTNPSKAPGFEIENSI